MHQIERVISALAVACASAAAIAGDVYNVTNNQLSIPFVNVGTDTYTDVVVTVGNVVGINGGVPRFGADSYTADSNRLTIPSVSVSGTRYTNVTITVGSVVRVGGKLTPTSDRTVIGSQSWPGAALEGAVDYCRNRSIRWIAPIFADVNKDGVDDFILPISCYQGPDPGPGEKHNRQVIAAWKMFCSSRDGSHTDCTQERFGTPVINATGIGSGGGNPYVHVMEKAADINGDGYPDFWYALNRDDGRPGFDFNNPDDVRLLTQFCGVQRQGDWEWDCTRKSNQTVLLSQPDGTYKVVVIPWGPTNTQAMIMLPNKAGGFDAFSFNYGRWRAARLAGGTFSDVTSEYQSYRNIDEFGYPASPYVRAFSAGGTTYVVTAGAPRRFVSADILSANGGEWGFSLWKWIPGVGFDLSDYWIPAAKDTFAYQERIGSSTIRKFGASIRGHATFFPRWHFFSYTVLDPAEGPVLVVAQEAGTTAGDFFKAPVVANAIYAAYDYSSPNNRYLYTELSPVEGFYIRDGKLVPRERSVIAGDAVWNSPGLLFDDLNGDGYADALGVSGHAQAGKIYINDGTGTLHKLYTNGVVPEFTSANPEYRGGFGWTLRSLDKSRSTTLLWWGTGFSVLPSWAGSTYSVPEVSLVRRSMPMDVLPVHAPEAMQRELQRCLTALTWIDQCSVK